MARTDGRSSGRITQRRTIAPGCPAHWRAPGRPRTPRLARRQFLGSWMSLPATLRLTSHATGSIPPLIPSRGVHRHQAGSCRHHCKAEPRTSATIHVSIARRLPDSDFRRPPQSIPYGRGTDDSSSRSRKAAGGLSRPSRPGRALRSVRHWRYRRRSAIVRASLPPELRYDAGRPDSSGAARRPITVRLGNAANPGGPQLVRRAQSAGPGAMMRLRAARSGPRSRGSDPKVAAEDRAYEAVLRPSPICSLE
jgi:hypothetical protein